MNLCVCASVARVRVRVRAVRCSVVRYGAVRCGAVFEGRMCLQVRVRVYSSSRTQLTASGGGGGGAPRQNRLGTFLHDAMIGAEYGSRVRSRA